MTRPIQIDLLVAAFRPVRYHVLMHAFRGVMLLVMIGWMAGCAAPIPREMWPTHPVDPAIQAQLDRLRAPLASPSDEGGLTMSASRLQHRDRDGTVTFGPFIAGVIDDAAETDPGVPIRLNGDDDDQDGRVDADDPVVHGDDDLVPVTIDHAAGITTADLTRSTPDLRVFAAPDKQHAIEFDGDGHGAIDLGIAQADGRTTIYVEWGSDSHGEGTLTITADDATDTIRFTTVRSLVIAIGGFNRSPPDDRAGVFVLGQRLHEMGYDVRMFAQQQMDEVLQQIRDGVRDHGIEHLAMMGHSSGSMRMYDILEDMAERDAYTALDVALTASIDTNYIVSRHEQPPLTRYHLNFYQHADLVHGQPVANTAPRHAQVFNFDVTSWDDRMSHTALDNHMLVHAAILFGRPGECEGLLDRLPR